MREIEVNKKSLLSVIEKNRAIHIKEYAEAKEGYRNIVTKKLRDALNEALKPNGELITSLTLTAPAPQNHVNDYDRVIGMLKMHTGKTILLDEHEYDNFVQDNWSWTHISKLSNSAYTAGVLR